MLACLLTARRPAVCFFEPYRPGVYVVATSFYTDEEVGRFAQRSVTGLASPLGNARKARRGGRIRSTRRSEGRRARVNLFCIR